MTPSIVVCNMTTVFMDIINKVINTMWRQGSNLNSINLDFKTI